MSSSSAGRREEARRSTGGPGSIPRMSTGSSPRASPARRALQPFTLEGRYKRGDGEWRWLRSVSQPRFGPDGELTGFIGVASDITLAKEAEIELRTQVEERTAKLGESEARFRAIFETVLEVLVLLSPDGTILELNRKEAAWRDPDPQAAVGKKIWDAPTLRPIRSTSR